MSNMPNDLEDLWNNLLSRQPELICTVFAKLDMPSQELVCAHLIRMAKEAGWQPEQRDSARAALKALGYQADKDESWI
jgi:hypothetical protein